MINVHSLSPTHTPHWLQSGSWKLDANQDYYWIDGMGQKHLISQISPQYARNIIHYLDDVFKSSRGTLLYNAITERIMNG